MRKGIVLFVIFALLLSVTPVFAEGTGKITIFQNLSDKASEIGKNKPAGERMDTGKDNVLQKMYEGAANFGTACPPEKKPAAVRTPFQTVSEDVATIGGKGAVPAVKNTVFQKAKDNMDIWNKTSAAAEPLSLRDNKEELARRRANKIR